jgi:PIN domain nuclease of toxin-antitoxin system
MPDLSAPEHLVAVVLDSSALLAYWLDEPGADVVTVAVAAEGAVVAAPNFAEALTKLVDRSPDLADKLPSVSPRLAGEEAPTLPGIPLAGGAISVEPFTIVDAVLCAKLRSATRSLGLSLGDRACLGLAQRLGLRALTADREWAKLSLEMSIEVIR